jgi:hypothetical protein
MPNDSAQLSHDSAFIGSCPGEEADQTHKLDISPEKPKNWVEFSLGAYAALDSAPKRCAIRCRMRGE